MEQTKIEALLEKSEGLLQEGKFYEYEQKVKLLSHRFKINGKTQELTELLLGAALKVLNFKQSAIGAELLKLALDALKSIQNFDTVKGEYKARIVSILKQIEYSTGKTALASQLIKEFYLYDNEICTLIAKEAQANKEYPIAQGFFTFSDDMPSIFAFLKEWVATAPGEEDYFIARFVLIKLSVNKGLQGKVIKTFFKKQFDTPIIHFVDFLIESIELNSEKAFRLLIEKYDLLFERDQLLYKLVRRIAAIYFNIAEEKPTNILSGFLSSLLG
eukprot:TRINITY_DN5377_c0_g1_i11.p2 TRINITY_DN5377_c0_g1~~TRINITY_DN5377_c0_g1_i11.p2  ORF type:complete len:273 (+),score=80.61 TRINITY_DN5377_c0_g1_i11:1064-1882(+)